jgi:photosystem II stability/assembly factor-like uncharacterized protein
MRIPTSAYVLAIAALASPIAPTATAEAQSLDELFQDLEWRNIGPANMAGRVTDIEAVDASFATVFVAAASGGVWKSTNAGTTWEAIFEDYGTGNIGDIAVFQPNPDIVWVGTGESCTRNSAGWGDGVYRSTDGGETFENVGLEDTHHIGEVITHPSDPDVAYVAAQGHLWGHSGDRGLFKTVDGGERWTKLTNGLPDDDRTGATDIVMDPRDPNVLFVASWERLRQPHRFDSGGPNGGIFKSTDGGESWTKLTNGLPEGETGKIGLALHRANPDIVMAIVEHGFQPEERVDGEPNPQYADMSQLGTGIYRSENGGQSWTYVNRYNNRPFYYSHIWMDPANDQRVYVLSGSAQVSEDGGRTFDRQLEGISGDFHALWINPDNPEIFYVGNDKGSYVTYDQGHSFIMYDNMDLGQFYAVTVDMRDPYWVYGGLQDNGNWGGPSNSRDWNGVLADHWFKFHSGDGFHTTPDPNDWRTVYTESQGGNIRRRDAVFRQQGHSITPNRANILNLADHYPEVASQPLETEDTGSQFQQANELPREHFRFNWSSPLILSPHDSKTIYFGGNHVFKSTDQGATWWIVSPDLSTVAENPELAEEESGGLTRDVTQAETHATAITIAESPVVPGLIWVGTDDGNVQITRDGGATWTNVRANVPDVPAGLWVSRVEASRYAEGTAYVTFDGHRSDNFDPWVFRTRDYGATWESISSDLPTGHSVYVIEEDPKNPNLLFVGTEFGAFATVDGGAHWSPLKNGLPTVSVHDLVVHPRDGDLVAATHGRSVWILDDITALQQLAGGMPRGAHLFQPRVATQWNGISRGATRGHKLFQGKNPLTIRHREPGNSPDELESSAAIHYLLPSGVGSATLEVSAMDGSASHKAELAAEAGIHRYYWDMRYDPTEEQLRTHEARLERARQRFGGQIPAFFEQQPAQGTLVGPGTYLVRLTVDGVAHEGTVTVRPDPGVSWVR